MRPSLRGGLRGQLAEQRRHDLLRPARMGDGLRFVLISWCSDDNQRDHAHGVVWQAFDAVEAWLIEGDCNVLIDLSDKGRGIGRYHALDRLGVVPLVGRYELDRVTGLDLHQRGLEYHDAVGSLVEHFHLDFGSTGPAAESHESNDS